LQNWLAAMHRYVSLLHIAYSAEADAEHHHHYPNDDPNQAEAYGDVAEHFSFARGVQRPLSVASLHLTVDSGRKDDRDNSDRQATEQRDD